MPIKICPNCNRRILYSHGDVDVSHECNSGRAAQDQEDVPVVGDWTDYTGDGIKNNANMQGIGNKFTGTRAGLEGEEPENVTVRGNNKNTTRKRQHIEHIELVGVDNTEVQIS